jgi:hypothetical protein
MVGDGSKRVRADGKPDGDVRRLAAQQEKLVNDWPEFDEPEEAVSGAEAVDWLGEFRQEAKALLSEIDHGPGSSAAPGEMDVRVAVVLEKDSWRTSCPTGTAWRWPSSTTMLMAAIGASLSPYRGRSPA